MKGLVLVLMIVFCSRIAFADQSIPTISRKVTLEFDGKKNVEQAVFEAAYVINPDELMKLVRQAKSSANWPVQDSRQFEGKVELDLLIPANYLVQAMTMYEEIDLSTNTLELFQVFQGERIKLLQARVATGQPGMNTPEGNFCLKRVTEWPWYYPPKEWRGDTRRVSPWPNRKNPYGRWVSEILEFSLEPAGYEFAPKGILTRNGVNQHSTNKSPSIGHYVSHACVRIHPDVAARLFPFFSALYAPPGAERCLARSGSLSLSGGPSNLCQDLPVKAGEKTVGDKTVVN